MTLHIRKAAFETYISCGIASSTTGWKYNGVLTLGHAIEARKAGTQEGCAFRESFGESSNGAVRPSAIEHGH